MARNSAVSLFISAIDRSLSAVLSAYIRSSSAAVPALNPPRPLEARPAKPALRARRRCSSGENLPSASSRRCLSASARCATRSSAPITDLYLAPAAVPAAAGSKAALSSAISFWMALRPSLYGLGAATGASRCGASRCGASRCVSSPANVKGMFGSRASLTSPSKSCISKFLRAAR